MTHQDIVGIYATATDSPALQGLSAVDWFAISHAHGPATDIPALLRALVSDVPEHRQAACAFLCETIWHQGNVYEATAVVVPFLYGLLEAGEVPDKEFAAFLIATIADGRGSLECNTKTPEDTAMCERILAKQGKILSEELARERAFLAAIHVAVASKLELLLPYVLHSESEVRLYVAIALGYFPEIAFRWLPDLRATFENEADDYTREQLGELISYLAKHCN